MNYSINPISNEDSCSIMDIYNYYIENSLAAYPECKLPYQAFDRFLLMSQSYPSGVIKDNNGMVVGFGLLRAHNPIATFLHTAEITYFLDHDEIGKGIGKKLLEYLEKGGRNIGITTLLASISAQNSISINFHRKNGFKKCGHFKQAYKKWGELNDIIWMQKLLQ